MIIENEYTNEPVKYNALSQTQRYYSGWDSLNIRELAKGQIIAALTGPESTMIGDYYTEYEKLFEKDLDSVKLCQGVQVRPFYNKESDTQPQYKTNARIYVVNENVSAAYGDTTENSHFGIGGLPQLAIPNGKAILMAAIKDEQIYNPKHTLIPIDLNTFRADPRLSPELKEKLQHIKEKAGSNICAEDGSIRLENTEISRSAYKLINARMNLHVNIAKYNCLMKEYTDELQKGTRDLERMRALKKDIASIHEDISDSKYKLNQDCNKLKKNPELMKEFTKEQQAHLLNVDTCSPKATIELTEYLKRKATFLEDNLEGEEKEQLNIKVLDDKKQSKGFERSGEKEKALERMYEGYSAVDPYSIVKRELVFAPYHLAQEQILLKEKQFCYLKCKDDLMTLMDNTGDKEVKGYCKQQIHEISKILDVYDRQIKESSKLIGKIDSLEYDDKLKYLSAKTELGSSNLRKEYSTGAVGKVMEAEINAAKETVHKKIEEYLSKAVEERNGDLKDLGKAYKLNRFSDLGNKIEQLKQRLTEIDNNNAKMQAVQIKVSIMEKALSQAEKSLKIVEEYKDGAHKDSYSEEKTLYDQARRNLKASGISSREDYNSKKESLENIKNNIELKKKDLKLQSSGYDELYNSLSELEDTQKSMLMNESGKSSKLKEVSMSSKFELER